MAAALVDLRSEGSVAVRSAGTAPADAIDSTVVEAMSELGVDLSSERPKALTDAAVGRADVVVTMGCGDACPFIPGTRYEDWQLDDPAGLGVEAVRPIRDELGRRVRELLGSLGVDPA